MQEIDETAVETATPVTNGEPALPDELLDRRFQAATTAAAVGSTSPAPAHTSSSRGRSTGPIRRSASIR